VVRDRRRERRKGRDVFIEGCLIREEGWSSEEDVRVTIVFICRRE
jgi:hypothetical protein